MIQSFISNQPQIDVDELSESIINTEGDRLTILESITSDWFDKVKTYTKTMAELDDTWKFWWQFIFEDCLSYLSLYLAIRCRNWNLRLSALKMMAPVFAGYDRTTYRQIIPNHLADIQCFPKQVIDCMKNGGFSVCINEKKGSAVALDEAHEMCVNKDLKNAIIRPTKEYLQKTSLFLRYRIAAYKNLLSQVFPSDTDMQPENITFYSDCKSFLKIEENVKAMIDEATRMNLFPLALNTNRGLMNVFSAQKATSKQSHDLLNFSKIGKEHLNHHIKLRILRKPSIDAPIRKHRLLTMAPIDSKKN